MSHDSSPFPRTRLLLTLGALCALVAAALLAAGSVSNLASRLLLRLPVPDFSNPALPLVLGVLGCLWLWLTAAGLARRLPWSRLSVVGVAIACLALGIWLIGGTSLASLTSPSISRHLRMLYLIFLCAYASLVLLGLCWLVYFNLPLARYQFTTRRRP